MAIRDIVLTGDATDVGTQIKPAEVFFAPYVVGRSYSDAYDAAKKIGYTGEDIKIKMTPKKAVIMQQGSKAVQRMTGNELKMTGTLYSWATADQLALALGIKTVDPDSNPGHTRVWFDANFEEAQGLWIVKTEDATGLLIELVIFKGPVGDPGEFGIGANGEEFTSLALDIDALGVELDDHDGVTMGYIDFEVAA